MELESQRWKAKVKGRVGGQVKTPHHPTLLPALGTGDQGRASFYHMGNRILVKWQVFYDKVFVINWLSNDR